MSVIPLAALVFIYESDVQAKDIPNVAKAPILFFQHAGHDSVTQEKEKPTCYQIQLSQLKERVI